MTLKFTVTPDGSVVKVSTEGMSAPDPDLQGCVIKALKRLKFPAPSDKTAHQISYPFVLRPE